MKIITLEKTKELLGISDTSLDTQITRYIPIIDSKIKMITKNRYNYFVYGATTSGSKIIELYSVNKAKNLGINNKYCIDDLDEYLQVGSLISGEGIAADTYIDDIYYNGDAVELSGTDYSVPIIEMSENATATNESAQIFIGFNIGLQTTVAKGIYWLITQESTSIPTAGLISKSIGGTSKSWSSADSKIDGKSGMPAWFVKAFPRYMSGH